MKPTRRARRLSRNSPCPCGSGLKLKRCCQVVETFDLPGGLEARMVSVTPQQAKKLEGLMRGVNEAQRQGHEIKGHDCPICRYLEQEGLSEGGGAVLPAA